MQGREPLLRNPMVLSRELANACLLDNSHIIDSKLMIESKVMKSELLMTSVPPEENQTVQNVFHIFSGALPLRTSSISVWPATLNHLSCLHCGGLCDVGPPLPAVRHYESQLDQYWVFGPFCRPCCSFGYICETDSTSKQLAPTIEVLRRFFGVMDVHIAPPRCAHERFGGPLKDNSFYGNNGYVTLKTLQPPFVTFANYVVGFHRQQQLTNDDTITYANPTILLPQSAGRLTNLQRPVVRTHALAEKKPTLKCPLLLEFLATMDTVQTIHESETIDTKASSLPKKRSESNNNAEGNNNFLKQFIKKQKS